MQWWLPGAKLAPVVRLDTAADAFEMGIFLWINLDSVLLVFQKLSQKATDATGCTLKGRLVNPGISCVFRRLNDKYMFS